MSNDEKISITKELMNKIKIGLNNISLATKDKNIKKEAEDLVKLVEAELIEEEVTVAERILKRMRETKNVDPDTNANLYILHRKLVNNQISETQALQMLEMYSKTENMDTRFIY